MSIHGFEVLKSQLLIVAEAMKGDEVDLLLSGLFADVERGRQETLELFPVAHHSPASGLHMLRRLSKGPAPKVIFMEACEDLLPLLPSLPGCKWPIALQAFAGQSDAFPPDWTPLSVLCPLSPFGAEFQAMAFVHHNPETKLVFVDRSVDHIFQWRERDDEQPEPDEDQLALGAIGYGIELGSTRPTLDLFVDLLLRASKSRHYAEWWSRYVEAPLLGSDTETYRQMMFLVGSLIRRLGRRESDIENDRLRERYMWTRMKDWLKENQVAAKDAMWICGAAHTASDVEEWGADNPKRWEIPERSSTRWLYGLTPSSFSAIEHQFSHPPGTLSQAEAEWDKAISRFGLQPFQFEPSKAKKSKNIPAPEAELGKLLLEPPPPVEEDEAQLLHWCASIVGLARQNGYLASTADSIAVYQTSQLLANLRDRAHPTPWDFIDAAITCLEKDRVPKKRNIQRLCEILLAADRIGKVAYDALPALARDVVDRLKVASINTEVHAIQRVLLDIRANPQLLPASDLLWKLRWLWDGQAIVRPIMGEKVLGRTPIQESWDVAIGRHQGSLVQLGYEGLTVEHVIEKRLKRKAFADDASTLNALDSVYDAVLLLGQPRLSEELGDRACALLLNETSGTDAPAIFKKVRELVHHFRATPEGIPGWLGRIVTSGYQHFSSLLPTAMVDEGTAAEAVAGMLNFLFTLEALALSLGCKRSQLETSIHQAGQLVKALDKRALLWTAEWLIGIRKVETIRTELSAMVDNPMLLDGLPDVLRGFLLALGFAPAVSALTVEALSRAFERLPAQTLYPWLPSLILSLRSVDSAIVSQLFREAQGTLPGSVTDLESWVPPWERKVASKAVAVVAPTSILAEWLRRHPAAIEAHFGSDWSGPAAGTEAGPSEVSSGADPLLSAFISHYPEAARAWFGNN